MFLSISELRMKNERLLFSLYISQNNSRNNNTQIQVWSYFYNVYCDWRISKLSFQNWSNNVFSYYLYCWMVSCLSCSWGGPSFWWRGRVVGPRAEGQVTEPSISIAEQEGREAAVCSSNFLLGASGNRFQVWLNFSGWFTEAKSQLEAPSWIWGSRHEGDTQGCQIAKSWPRKDSRPVWAFQELKKSEILWRLLWICMY